MLIKTFYYYLIHEAPSERRSIINNGFPDNALALHKFFSASPAQVGHHTTPKYNAKNFFMIYFIQHSDNSRAASSQLVDFISTLSYAISPHSDQT